MRAWGREAYAPDGPGHGSRLHEIESVSLADYPRVYSEFIVERNLDRVVLVFDGPTYNAGDSGTNCA